MSVLVLDKEVFQAVANKAISYTFTKQCDINYCYTFSALGEQGIIDFMRDIIYLNELSWCKRYEDEDDVPEMFSRIKLGLNGKTISTLQCLKYLQCVEYNIELDTIKGGKTGAENNEIKPQLMDSYNKLKEVIQDLQNTVINHLTNYKDLNWSNI